MLEGEAALCWRHPCDRARAAITVASSFRRIAPGVLCPPGGPPGRTFPRRS